MEKILTVAITTYNRRERLLNQLHSLYKQPESSEISIVIIDNHSNYDVRSAIIDEFGEEKCSNLKVSVNPVNFGMGANLAMPFLNCDTKWLWTLSDDDLTLEGSLKTIFEDINKDPNTLMYKYQINNRKTYPDTQVNSIPEIIDFYLSNKLGSGHLIFLSTNVYNMEIAMQYYGLTLTRSYCDIAQLLPVFHALDNGAGHVTFRNIPIVEFVRPEPGSSYNYLHTAVSISTTAQYQFNMSDHYHKKLGFLVTNGFSHYRIIRSALMENDRQRGKFLYEQVYNRSFKYSGSILDKAYHMLYYFCYYLHINLPYDAALKFRTFMRKYFPNFR